MAVREESSDGSVGRGVNSISSFVSSCWLVPIYYGMESIAVLMLRTKFQILNSFFFFISLSCW